MEIFLRHRSHPFVSVPTQGGQPPATVQFVEGGPVHLTRFVKMLLDSCCASDDQSWQVREYWGASILLEGATAWGVWLRIDQCFPHWGTDQG